MKNDILFEGALTNQTRKALNHNVEDRCVVIAEIDITSSTTGATLTNVPELITDTTHKLEALMEYMFEANLSVISTANSGVKVAFAQTNGLTLSQFECLSNAKHTGTADVITHVTSTTAGTSVVATTTVIQQVILKGTFTTTTGGTLQLQMAQNASHADTTSIFKGSTLVVKRVGKIDTTQ